MPVLIIGILSLLIGLTLIVVYGKKLKHQIKIDQTAAKENARLLKQQEELTYKNQLLQNEYHHLLVQIRSIKQDILADHNLAQSSFEKYCDNLETEYLAVEHSFDKRKKLLEQTYSLQQQDLERQYEYYKKEFRQAYENYVDVLESEYDAQEARFDNEVRVLTENLDNLKQTYAAAREAQIREEEMATKADFYCLHLSVADQTTIALIEELKIRLPDPRVLCMLIWSTYYQKQMTSLCNNILGTSPVCGIYKITNKKNGLCYIGQAVDIATRWKAHAKCGLGIDTPAQNKLYRAMQKDGLINFTFELLEACDRTQLNEKEKFYINLYQACDYGYNSTAGNK